MLNLKVDAIESEEGPGYGAAMLAAVACGEYDSVQDISETLVRIVDTVEPDVELAARYEERYQQFKQIYPALCTLWSKGYRFSSGSNASKGTQVFVEEGTCESERSRGQ